MNIYNTTISTVSYIVSCIIHVMTDLDGNTVGINDKFDIRK